ncbi:MAG: GNAT family N-acetyltransferase [Planctomycetota bacterium]
MPDRDPRLAPITLAGDHARLEPLSLAHVDALCEVGLDPALWEFKVNNVRTRDDMRAYVQEALDDQAAGTALPFVIVDVASGRVAGTTRFGNVLLAHHRVEIGWTMVALPWQRTALNTECKLLLLRHAFGPLQCQRVELKTDALNVRSRAAIRRLGATEEGTLRRHLVTWTGRVRDSVYYSILDDEWPAVERRLMERLAQG